MTFKIILFIMMFVGALLVYLANPIARLIFNEDNEKNMLTVKATGFIIVMVSAIIVFVRF